MKHPLKTCSFWLMFLVIGLLIGYFYNPIDQTVLNQIKEFRGEQNKFTSPLLDCEAGTATRSGLVEFGDKLESLVKESIRDGKITESAIYYRDLSNGPWFGVNEQKEFIPASLFKLPLVMAYYYEAQKDTTLLEKKYLFKKKYENPMNATQNIVPGKEIEVGQSYTAKELAERALIYSDNQAAWLLLEHTNLNALENLFMRIEADESFRNGMENFAISVKDYSAFMRILYNASYLNNHFSEIILEFLSRSEFMNGLRAGVPEKIAVAHKFGEAGSRNEVRQVHDCGIIYHPKRPYILCVMTRGTNLLSMQKFIAEISAFTYNAVDRQVQ